MICARNKKKLDNATNQLIKIKSTKQKILSRIADVSIDELSKNIAAKDFGAIRKWVASHEIDNTTLFRKLYDTLYDTLKPQSIPQAVIILADYQYKAAFVADQEINTVACLTELMVSCEYV